MNMKWFAKNWLDQLMVNWWFGAWWFGILGVQLSNNSFIGWLEGDFCWGFEGSHPWDWYIQRDVHHNFEPNGGISGFDHVT